MIKKNNRGIRPLLNLQKQLQKEIDIIEKRRTVIEIYVITILLIITCITIFT